MSASSPSPSFLSFIVANVLETGCSTPDLHSTSHPAPRRTSAPSLPTITRRTKSLRQTDWLGRKMERSSAYMTRREIISLFHSFPSGFSRSYSAIGPKSLCVLYIKLKIKQKKLFCSYIARSLYYFLSMAISRTTLFTPPDVISLRSSTQIDSLSCNGC